MKKLTLSILALTLSNSCFANGIEFTRMVFGRVDHNIIHPNTRKVVSELKTQIVIQKNENGTYDLTKVVTGSVSQSIGPIGALSKGMDCIFEGDYSDVQSVNCSKDESKVDGRIDSALIQKNADNTYSVTYTWKNLTNEENKGSKQPALGLGLESINDGKKEMSFSPGAVSY